MTGCARSEGYYAISRKEKDVYLDLDGPDQALLDTADYDNTVQTPNKSKFSAVLTISKSSIGSFLNSKGKCYCIHEFCDPVLLRLQ